MTLVHILFLTVCELRNLSNLLNFFLENSLLSMNLANNSSPCLRTYCCQKMSDKIVSYKKMVSQKLNFKIKELLKN